VHLDKTLHLIGVDISKWAVIEAAKRNKNIRWIVGSNSNLPIQDTSLDWVFSLFGFPIFTEFERVLKQGGKVLLIDAGENHLKELRQIIYPLLKPAKERRDTTPQNFTTIIEENISFPITLSTQEEIANLLAMTPHLYRANAEGRSKALALTQLTVTIDIDVKILLCDNS
jgi:23S rRNA (guanine745-N1)-methyltransferase